MHSACFLDRPASHWTRQLHAIQRGRRMMDGIWGGFDMLLDSHVDHCLHASCITKLGGLSFPAALKVIHWSVLQSLGVNVVACLCWCHLLLWPTSDAASASSKRLLPNSLACPQHLHCMQFPAREAAPRSAPGLWRKGSRTRTR